MNKIALETMKERQIEDIIEKRQALNAEEAEIVWKKNNKKKYMKKLWNNKGFYLMFLPVAIVVIIMHYWPMLGIRYAFFDYKPVGEPVFVGFAHFQKMFFSSTSGAFWTSFFNTLWLSIVKLLLTTLTSVLVAVFLNEMKNIYAKKALQTLIYLPHFMSWAVVASIFTLMLSPSATGMINGILKDLNLIDPEGAGIYFLADKKLWQPIFFIINIWKETGWGTVIFLATLSGIDPGLYEAAEIDGASRLQRVWHVTVPALVQTIIIVLILNLAKVMNMFESVFVLYNDSVLDVSDVISTYIYRQTFLQALPNYGYTTAVGLFKAIVGAGLVIFCNQLSKKVRGRGIL